MDKLTQFLMRPYINLAFALFCGANYYIIVLRFILSHTANGGLLLAFFFLPAVVAGGGLVVLKTLKAWREQGLTRRMNALVLMNIALFAVNMVLIADMLTR